MRVVDNELMQMPPFPTHRPQQGDVQLSQGNICRNRNGAIDLRLTIAQLNAQHHRIAMQWRHLI